MISTFKYRAFACAAALLASGCAMAPPPVAESAKGDVAVRAMETRIYPVADRGVAIRAVIATLQDLGYNVDRLHGSTGTVTAVKLSALRISVAVTPHGPGQMAVRADAEVQSGLQYHQVDEPSFYDADFFQALSQTLSATAASADGGDSTVGIPEPLYSDPKS